MQAADRVNSPEIVEETIGCFLLRRLRELGLKHLFGVAGDFNLEFLDQVEADPGIAWVGCCNELNASYAADGHARTAGLAALVTTYGVGELSALCGVAGACAEHLPVVHIVGAPPLDSVREHAVMHHTMGEGEFGDMLAAAQPFSAAQARLDPEVAVIEIDRCLQVCLLQKRPVYLQLPSDVAYVTVHAPAGPLTLAPSTDSGMLQEFTEAAAMKIAAATSMAILVDADVARFGQSEAVVALARHLGAPIAVMGTAKAVIDETSPSYLGVYSGKLSAPEVKAAIETADCLLMFGVRFADSTTASFSQSIVPDRCIRIDGRNSSIASSTFNCIAMPDAISALLQSVKRRDVPGPKLSPAAPSANPSAQDEERIQQAFFWNRMASFVREKDVLTAENGTSLSGVTGMALKSGVTVIAQALWGSIGYSLPACFGSMIAAPERRHLLFIGDGSFQLTVQELSSMLRHRLKPIIFLINNDGYTIERLILGEKASYNDIQPWKYSALCDVFANGSPFHSCRVSSTHELEEALAKTESSDGCFFIEVVMDRMDAPKSLKTLGPIYADQDYGKSWQRRTPQAKPNA